jgi:hypothetical protein
VSWQASELGARVPTWAKRATGCLTCRQPIRVGAAIAYYVGVGATHHACGAPADLAQLIEKAQRRAMGGTR